MEFEGPFFPMPITRSRVMLEAASELVGMKIWSYRQARISLRDQEEGEWRIGLFGSDNPEVIEAVDRGEVHIATLNPAAPLSLAYRGCGPFKEPIAVRAMRELAKEVPWRSRPRSCRGLVQCDGAGDDDDGVGDEDPFRVRARVNKVVHERRQDQVLLPEDDPVA